MKSFNKIVYALMGVVLMAFTSCQEDIAERVPSPTMPDGCMGVYFPAQKAVYELDPADETKITLTIARADSTLAAEVPMTVEVNTDSVYVVPATVAFAADQASATFDVTFPTAGEGTGYELRLAVKGDEYVNSYAQAKSYLSLTATRIAWVPAENPGVMTEGVTQAWFSTSPYPFYVNYEVATLSGGITKYRILNPFTIESVEGEVDENGVLDAFLYTPDELADGDHNMIIEVGVNGKNVANIPAFNTGVSLNAQVGFMIAGTILDNLTGDLADFVYGSAKDGVISFPENSMFAYGSVMTGIRIAPATTFYVDVETYKAANDKVDDYNVDPTYTEVYGEVSEFHSVAMNDAWNQTIEVAENPEGKTSLRDLYYLPDLFAEGFGLAFYDSTKIIIPDAQPTGLNIFGEDIFMSASAGIPSKKSETAKGVTMYELGLALHTEDGAIYYEGVETFYYKEDAIEYAMEDFVGHFEMSASSPFGEPDVEGHPIEIVKDGDNLAILGFEPLFTPKVIATFDAANSTINIAPQKLADVEYQGTTLDATFFTCSVVDGALTPGATAVIEMGLDLSGGISLTESSEGIGYLVQSVALGGWADGWLFFSFTSVPAPAAGTPAKTNAASYDLYKAFDLSSLEVKAPAREMNLAPTGRNINDNKVVLKSNLSAPLFGVIK